MAYTPRLLNAIPGIRHAFLDVHETAAFTYAELAPVKLVRFAYPVMDSVALGYQPYAGYDGLPILLSDILNALMTVPYRRNGRFNP